MNIWKIEGEARTLESMCGILFVDFVYLSKKKCIEKLVLDCNDKFLFLKVTEKESETE